MTSSQRTVIETFLSAIEQNRQRTLTTLDEVVARADGKQVLAFRPGPGRAPIQWQFLHIAITEELFATERLFGRPAAYSELVPRFKGGSVPDDEMVAADQIRVVLQETRQHLINSLATFNDDDLGVIPEPFRERGWNLRKILQVLSWHEAHHQGQAHLTLNLYKAAHQ